MNITIKVIDFSSNVQVEFFHLMTFLRTRLSFLYISERERESEKMGRAGETIYPRVCKICEFI